jgi:branched-chain amino acid transport system permease protein
MTILQALIDAVALGSLYALVAVGIGLVFGVMRLINFAHGELLTAGAYALALTSGRPPLVSVAACLAVVVALAVLMERVAFRPLRGAAPATMLVATFAVAFLLQAVWLLSFGPQGARISVFPQLNQALALGDLRIRWVTLVTIVVGSLLLGGTVLLLQRTTLGLQMRAAAVDFRTARLLGVRADTVILLAFLVAGVLAAAVTILLTVQRPLVTPSFGLMIMIPVLVGVVVGGMDRLGSATLGGFSVGFAISVLGNVLPPDRRVFLDSVLFGLVILVLLVRPNGLFRPGGAVVVERV